MPKLCSDMTDLDLTEGGAPPLMDDAALVDPPALVDPKYNSDVPTLPALDGTSKARCGGSEP